MNELNNTAIRYFGAPINYFWTWAEKGEVIEWQDGSTICYREELMPLLKGLTHQGLPPLGTLLLMMAACQARWKAVSLNKTELLLGIAKQMEEDSGPGHEVLEYYIHQTVRFLHIIHQLPKELRSGKNITHLIKEVFAKKENYIPAGQARSIVYEFGSGRLDYPILRRTEEISGEEFKADLEYFNQALSEFPNAQALEVKLRTGLNRLPEKQELELSEQETPQLLEQLSEDAKTEGISRLTKRLLAALNIPMHSQGSSQLPYGGISDITNRGSFDRLLLSELAQDDESLMARLVNNEALFLRREEPPDTLNRQRTILVDSTIKMWGTPRVFAISAALACVQHTRPTIAVHTWALGGYTFEPINLASKGGVIESLEHLDPALHCGEALQAFMDNEQRDQPHEYILITDEGALHHQKFGQTLSGLKKALTFLITVNRKGDLGFYEYVSGRTRLLNKAKFDLKELLFTPAKTSRKGAPAILPAFLSTGASPLYFPTSAMRLSAENTFHNSDFGLVGITANQRVLYWPFKLLGAREIVNYIEPGSYYFGYDGVVTLYILVSDVTNNLLKFYKIHTVKNEVESRDLSAEIPAVQEAIFHANLFFMKTSNGVMLFDCVNSRVDEHQHKETITQLYFKYKKQRIWSDFGHLKRYINNGYSVLQRVHTISLTPDKKLCLDDYMIRLIDNEWIKLVDTRKVTGIQKPLKQELHPEDTITLPNPAIKFSRTVWKDGSEAVVDSRGMIYLRSSDPSIPEIAIVLVLGKASACWASDGKVCGAFYFTGADPFESLPTDIFYSTYIQRFIDRLL